MRRLSVLILILAALLTSSLTFAQTGDVDGDGVGDSRDRCPDTAGPTQFMGCPDSDNDGVVDIDDACAAVPGIPENRGCPQDSDGDGTGDFEDACPNEAGSPENRGCSTPPTGTSTDTDTGTPTARPGLNPLDLPLDGNCVAAPIFNGRVNVRVAPSAAAEIVATLDPNIPTPVLGLIALPGEESYYVYELEDLIISGAVPAESRALLEDIVIAPDATGPFDPAFLGNVFVAASVMNVAGDCGPTPVGLLLPAIQKVREAAARSPRTSQATLTVRKLGLRQTGASSAMEVTMSDLLVSSLTAADEGSAAGGSGMGAGKVSYNDLSIVLPAGFIVATIVEGENGDELVFDLLPNDPDTESQVDYFLKIDTLKAGDESDPIVGPLMYIMARLSGLRRATVSPTGDCDSQFLDQLAALGGEILAIPTAYGVEFVGSLPEGAQPGEIIPCIANSSGDVVPTEQMSLNFTKITWNTADDGTSHASLMKIGPGTLSIGGSAIAEDGSVCIDLQPAGSPLLCVPKALPDAQ